MKKSALKLALALVLAFLAGCAVTGCSAPKVAENVQIPADTSEQLVYSTHAERPVWTVDEPEAADGVLSFVGTSARHASEKSAREYSRRNTINAVVKYMGTLAKEKFEKAQVTYGLESSVIDATESSRVFEKQLSTNMATKVKVAKWYGEKWQTPTGTGWQYFAMATVPREAADESFKLTAAAQARKAEQQAKEAADAIAKGGHVLEPRGEFFTEDNIRERLTMRNFMDELRGSGVNTGGPPALDKGDRQAFANQLDRFLARGGP